MPAQEELRKFASIRADLGESPVWDEATRTLYFVDISGGKIHALDEHARLSTLYTSTSRIGALALTEVGNLVFTHDSGVAILDRQTLRVTLTSGQISSNSSCRFNDGACDPQGRFITGLMDESHSQDSGKLFSYDSGLKPLLLHQPMGLPNGLVWDEEGRELFFVDSVARRIFRADYSIAAGTIGQISVFAETPAHLGRPDGLAMDREGGVWVCQFNGGCLLRYNRSGVLTDNLPVPVPRPTSCCFGGTDMRTLYITTARFGMSTAELASYPEAGDLYYIRLATPGCVRHRFKEL